MSFPSKSNKLTIRGNEYAVNFPNNGQLMAIYNRRSQLINESLNYSTDGNARYAYLLAETISTFEVVLPAKFWEDLQVKSLTDLDLPAGIELIKVYQEQWEPWFDKWIAAINELMKPAKKEA